MSSLQIPAGFSFDPFLAFLTAAVNENDTIDATTVAITTDQDGTPSNFISKEAANAILDVAEQVAEIANDQDLNDNLDSAEEFTISQLSESGAATTEFKFALSPAVESSVGGKQVPEVKPGILKRVCQNIKTFNLPGAIPAFQVLGIKPTMLQMVGLIVGAENVEDGRISSQPNPGIRGPSMLYNTAARPNALWYSEYFERFLVQEGRPVEINVVNSQMSLKYTALIQNHRHFVARADRIYYSIDALVLDYPNFRNSSFDSVVSSTTATPVTNAPRSTAANAALRFTAADSELLLRNLAPNNTEFVGPLPAN